MPWVGFEPTISAGERPKTYALDRTATGTGGSSVLFYLIDDARTNKNQVIMLTNRMGNNSLRSYRENNIGRVEFAGNVQYLTFKISVESDPTVVRQRSRTPPEVVHVWDLPTSFFRDIILPIALWPWGRLSL